MGENPWKSDVFRNSSPELQAKMTPSSMRTWCLSKQLINAAGKRTLAAIADPNAHNERLLEMVKGGNARSFHIFCEILREKEPSFAFAAVLEQFSNIDKYATGAAPTPAPTPETAATPETAPTPETTPLVSPFGIPNGQKHISACHVENLAAAIEPVLYSQRDEFARWAVQFTDKSMTGSEYGVLRGYLEERKDMFSSATSWSHLWCVFSFLADQTPNDPTVDQVYEKLRDLSYGQHERFLRIFKDDAMYRRPQPATAGISTPQPQSQQQAQAQQEPEPVDVPNNGNRKLCDVADLEELADDLKPYLGDVQRERFAKKVAMVHDVSMASTYRNVIPDHIRVNVGAIAGDAKVTNVYGVLHWAQFRVPCPTVNQIYACLTSRHVAPQNGVHFQRILSDSNLCGN